jgi:hypothetical protein
VTTDQRLEELAEKLAETADSIKRLERIAVSHPVNTEDMLEELEARARRNADHERR